MHCIQQIIKVQSSKYSLDWCLSLSNNRTILSNYLIFTVYNTGSPSQYPWHSIHIHGHHHRHLWANDGMVLGCSFCKSLIVQNATRVNAKIAWPKYCQWISVGNENLVGGDFRAYRDFKDCMPSSCEPAMASTLKYSMRLEKLKLKSLHCQFILIYCKIVILILLLKIIIASSQRH